MARKSYLELIQRHPQSRYIPTTFLAFGELFMNEAASDPMKYALAEQAYLEVIKYPPPDNRSFAYAHYRLAQVYVKRRDDQRALSHLVKAIQSARGPADQSALAAAVRREVVEVYARAGNPATARAFFSRFAAGAELEGMLKALDERRTGP